ncbi:hypothetical protein DFH07DRAFT_368584 [Mycena maculata]|uniref:Uncharacterized protein n=1 Tax=Mycena maculata TaxID=230809 RepID=A0AAD7H8J4_9AGAR|nr:hypothetical protein DFH07DRAFT_368584 [Mycena maculata]
MQLAVRVATSSIVRDTGVVPQGFISSAVVRDLAVTPRVLRPGRSTVFVGRSVSRKDVLSSGGEEDLERRRCLGSSFPLVYLLNLYFLSFIFLPSLFPSVPLPFVGSSSLLPRSPSSFFVFLPVLINVFLLQSPMRPPTLCPRIYSAAAGQSCAKGRRGFERNPTSPASSACARRLPQPPVRAAEGHGDCALRACSWRCCRGGAGILRVVGRKGGEGRALRGWRTREG